MFVPFQVCDPQQNSNVRSDKLGPLRYVQGFDGSAGGKDAGQVRSIHAGVALGVV